MPNIRSSDRGSFTDVGLIVYSPIGADTGAALDLAMVGLTSSATDPVTGVETWLLQSSNATPAFDSGSVAESGSISISITATDAGVVSPVVDLSSTPATVSAVDSGVVSSVAVTDGGAGGNIVPTATDSGAVSSTPSVAATLSASDSGLFQERRADWVDTGGGGGFAGPGGDHYSNPVVLASSSGTFAVDFSTATVDTGEPSTDPGDPNTIWLQWTAAANGYFSISTTDPSFDTIIEVYLPASDVSLLAEPIAVWEGAPNSGAISCTAGTVYLFRLYPGVAGTASIGLSIPGTYAFQGVTTSDITLTNTNIDWTPGNIICNVGNVDINSTVVFNVNGTDVLSTTSDDSGSVYNCSVPVPALDPGTYNIKATCNSENVTNTFTVNLGQLSGSGWSPSSPPSPSYTPPSDPVQYWVLFDETPGGETYTFERNPLEMTPIFAPRPLTVDTTTAWDGQAITWEAAKKASQFSFSGTLTSQTQLEAFERFGNLNRRVWLIDHNKDAWLITVEHVDVQPVMRVNADFAHTYQVDCLCFFGPVSL